MGRDISAGMISAAGAGSLSPAFFVEMDFSSGFVRAWSGIGTLVWDSRTWLGVGNLGQIEPLSETQDFVANGANLKLSGIPSDLISVALGEQYQGRSASIYLGLFDASGALIADPTILYAASMDTMEINEDGETSTITVRIESQAVSLKRSREWRYTHEDQQIDYPGDLGLEYIVGLQDKELVWRPA